VPALIPRRLGVVDVPRGLWASVWLVVKKRIKARRLRTHEAHEEKSRRAGSNLGIVVPRRLLWSGCSRQV